MLAEILGLPDVYIVMNIGSNVDLMRFKKNLYGLYGM